VKADEGLGIFTPCQPARRFGTVPYSLPKAGNVGNLGFVKGERFDLGLKGLRYINVKIGIFGNEAVEEKFLDFMGP